MKYTLTKKYLVRKCSPGDENYIVENMNDLLLIEACLIALGVLDSKKKFISGYCHTMLMSGLAIQLLKQYFFKRHDKYGDRVTIQTVIFFLENRYHTPYLQRVYRDPAECLKYAIAMLPILKEIEESRKCYFFKLPKLINS